MMFETRKILEDESIGVAVTCVRVPVRVGHSIAVNVQTREPLSAQAARDLLAGAPGLIVEDVPTPLRSEGRDEVFVGRIRDDESHPRASQHVGRRRTTCARARRRTPSRSPSCWRAGSSRASCRLADSSTR